MSNNFVITIALSTELLFTNLIIAVIFWCASDVLLLCISLTILCIMKQCVRRSTVTGFTFSDKKQSYNIEYLPKLSPFTFFSYWFLSFIISDAASPFNGSEGFGYSKSCGRNTSNTFKRSAHQYMLGQMWQKLTVYEHLWCYQHLELNSNKKFLESWNEDTYRVPEPN